MAKALPKTCSEGSGREKCEYGKRREKEPKVLFANSWLKNILSPARGEGQTRATRAAMGGQSDDDDGFVPDEEEEEEEEGEEDEARRSTKPKKARAATRDRCELRSFVRREKRGRTASRNADRHEETSQLNRREQSRAGTRMTKESHFTTG